MKILFMEIIKCVHICFRPHILTPISLHYYVLFVCVCVYASYRSSVYGLNRQFIIKCNRGIFFFTLLPVFVKAMQCYSFIWKWIMVSQKILQLFIHSWNDCQRRLRHAVKGIYVKHHWLWNAKKEKLHKRMKGKHTYIRNIYILLFYFLFNLVYHYFYYFFSSSLSSATSYIMAYIFSSICLLIYLLFIYYFSLFLFVEKNYWNKL